LSITDLRMPGMDGFQLISRIREMSDAHVLVLTALDSEENVIRGLELGADEYLVKPISKREFLARVRSIVRRAATPEDVTTGYSDSILSLNFLTHEAQLRGGPIHLRPTEFRLLAYLVRNQERVIAHRDILDGVWGTQEGSTDSLKWYISALREKLEEDPQRPSLIVTVPRVGYRYFPPELCQ
jgi:DNA-binding response OmpR family regulator